MLIILINETKFIIQIENRNYNIIMKFMMKFFKSKIQTNTRFIQENRLSIIPILPKCIIIIKKNHDFTCGVTYIFWFCSSYFFFLIYGDGIHQPFVFGIRHFSTRVLPGSYNLSHLYFRPGRVYFGYPSLSMLQVKPLVYLDPPLV